MRLLLINGPNLNLLGQREPSIYGLTSLGTIESEIQKIAKEQEFEIEFFQSNSEGELIDRIQKAINQIDGIMINAGAYTHTSIALRDALAGSSIPYVELHLSNTYAREDFRQKSLLAEHAIGVVCGFGSLSYNLALNGLLNFLTKEK